MAAVLIIEDDRVTAEETAAAVRGAGHSVIRVSPSAEEALNAAEQTRPDLALVDIELSGKTDGIAVAEQLQSRFDTAVIFVTGHSEPSILDQAIRTAAYGYVLKPVNRRTLQASIHMALARHSRDRGLRAHGAWLSNLLRNVGVAVLATDETGDLCYANALASALTGCPEHERASLDDYLRLVDERGAAFRPVELALSRSSPVDFPTGTLLAREGEPELPVEGSAVRLTDPGDRLQGVVVALRDVSERHNVERERQRVQRLEALSTLAAGIAHDFNNMLAIVLSGAALAKHAVRHDQRTTDLLTDVENAGERARKLTAELVAFARGGAPTRRTAELGPLLDANVNHALRGAATRLALNVEDGLWSVSIDTLQIGQVVTNLVRNARQAMRDGGTLSIRAHNRLVAKEDPVLPAGRFVELSVADTGPGIPAEHLDRIFDPFFTTEQGKSGLGLASSYSIMTRHGGTLRVESSTPAGTTFVALLPAAGAAAVALAAPAGTSRPSRILVMDDEDALRRVLALCLDELGYRVVQAAEGGEAIAHFRDAMEVGDPFDVVILDLTVREGLDGLAALEGLKTLDPNVRAIASSGYCDSPVIADHASFGFAGALQKPFHFAVMLNLLRQLSPRLPASTV